MNKKFLIVASDYYKDITKNLINGSLEKLKNIKKNITIIKVPGTFEIPVVISKNIKRFDGFIALGCVIKGQTPHFDFICNATFISLSNLSIKSNKPIGNGIITALNMKQATKRSNLKGKEAANAVLEVIKNG
tara:strand:- start:4447 stop:4842 length:396 start_codon:yes stop_codon:yes gene_type:complete